MNEQTKLWNGPAGHAWVEARAVLDEMFRPFEEMLVEGLEGDVLDVGCGTGSTTVAAARAARSAVGVDISEVMLAVGRARGEPRASFICADAQTHAFEPSRFHSIISRFGVMFFADSVAAFANLRRATVDGGELRFFAFRDAAENPFMTTAERAAAPLLPGLPPRRPGAPGQFRFADRGDVARILRDSGFRDVEITPIDVACAFPANELERYVTLLGPVGLILQQSDERTRAEVGATVRAAFDPYVDGSNVRFVAACWRVVARNSAT